MIFSLHLAIIIFISNWERHPIIFGPVLHQQYDEEFLKLTFIYLRRVKDSLKVNIGVMAFCDQRKKRKAVMLN